ncbi:hypothetical protein [Burkholderia stagnalis]|nr:hypothetical protein [Burkholderia stagnalis]
MTTLRRFMAHSNNLVNPVEGRFANTEAAFVLISTKTSGAPCPKDPIPP